MKILVTGIFVFSLSGCFATTAVDSFDASKASEEEFLAARVVAACEILELERQGPSIPSSVVLTMAHKSKITSLRQKCNLYPGEERYFCAKYQELRRQHPELLL